MQTPPLRFDAVFMGDAQCTETNEKSISDFYFSSYREKIIDNWEQKWPWMIITQEIKFEKIWNYIFLSIQSIPHLSFDFQLWKKNDFYVRIWSLGWRNMPLTLTCSDYGPRILKKFLDPWIFFSLEKKKKWIFFFSKMFEHFWIIFFFFFFEERYMRNASPAPWLTTSSLPTIVRDCKGSISTKLKVYIFFAQYNHRKLLEKCILLCHL